MAITDREKRYDAYREIELEILDRCYAVFLTQTAILACYRSDYVDWPAANYYKETGELTITETGVQFWLHDWGINK